MFAIQNKETKLFFFNFDESTGEDFWQEDNPWLYERECDALFALHAMKWYDESEVVPYEDNILLKDSDD